VAVNRPVVRGLAASDIPDAAAALASAFHDDPMMLWLVPDEPRRTRMLPEYFRAVLRQSARAGHPRVIEHGGRVVGASISMPPGTYPLPTLPQIIEWHAILTAGVRATVRHFRDLPGVDALRPDEPHWYLMYIGVAPEFNGLRLGTALLEATLAEADGAGLPTYLATMNPTNPAWYARFGLAVRAETTLGRRGPATWTMFRPTAAT